MAAIEFNPMAWEPLGEGFTVFPAGKYPVAIRKTEMKATNDKSSGYLQLDMEIQDGPHRGQTFAYRCNLYNQSESAREFASRMLTSICFVVGLYNPMTDTDMLRGIPFVIQLDEQEMEYRPQDDRSKPKKKTNELKAVFDIQGNLPKRPEQGGAPAGAPTGAPAATYAPPAGAPQQQQYAPPAGAPAQTYAPPAQPAQPPANNGWQGQPAGAPAQPAQPPAGGWTPPAAQPAGAPAAGTPSWAGGGA